LSETENIDMPIARIRVKERVKKRGKLTKQIERGRKKG
jgi:hypothetical protein